ncbi:LysE family translocator [uncultured Cohaesibacter sp.]|uniref:LysE family translocator n=1 Tax=uncultured Cohaesibacter sp. TaxID=1002546 RepID=UPI002AA6B14C|nr:LysE family translocator [uncultured Cohaesibacter sp.]
MTQEAVWLNRETVDPESRLTMFMSAEAWGLFLVACLMLNIAPGPDLIFILSRTLGHGRKIGFAASLGVCSGALVHVMAAALGVSAILATSATAFMLVKYVGAAYLIWLGAKALFSRESLLPTEAKAKARLSAWAAYRQGVMIDVLNPKVALFFLAFLPQFIPHDGSLSGHQILLNTVLLGAIVIAVGLVVEAGFIMLAAPLGAYLRNNKTVALWLDRTFGGLLVSLGAKLALTD